MPHTSRKKPPIDQKTFAKAFAAFAGRELLVQETKHVFKDGCGKLLRHRSYSIENTQQPVLREINGVMAQFGLSALRVILPGERPTFETQAGRMSARVQKEADGKYRFASFQLG